LQITRARGLIAPSVNTRLPELVAHRGWARRFPENTLAALEGAIGAGARHVEIDVQLSADEFPVLFHDRNLRRMCGASGAIHERSLAELRALSCAETARFGDQFASEGIASLAGFAQLLRRHPDVHAFVEVKRASIERFGAERVLERVLAAIEPAAGQCALISFALEFLAFSGTRSSLPLGAVFDSWSELDRLAPLALEPSYIFCDVGGLPRSGPLVHAGAKTVIYEVDDPKVAVALASRGVHMVESFAIGEMIAAFRAIETASD
jgi:glycerophosphoryl diester phosphodiesterase